eukprot:5837367-Pleurochrysis_carterae.AAC.1
MESMLTFDHFQACETLSQDRAYANSDDSAQTFPDEVRHFHRTGSKWHGTAGRGAGTSVGAHAEQRVRNELGVDPFGLDESPGEAGADADADGAARGENHGGDCEDHHDDDYDDDDGGDDDGGDDDCHADAEYGDLVVLFHLRKPRGTCAKLLTPYHDLSTPLLLVGDDAEPSRSHSLAPEQATLRVRAQVEKPSPRTAALPNHLPASHPTDLPPHPASCPVSPIPPDHEPNRRASPTGTTYLPTDCRSSRAGSLRVALLCQLVREILPAALQRVRIGRRDDDEARVGARAGLGDDGAGDADGV